MVLSLSYQSIMDNTEATKHSHLLLGSFLPAIRISMRIPVIQGSVQRFDQFIKGLKAPALEGQGTQLFPPRLNQVQPTSIFRDELNLNLGPGGQSQLSLATGMDVLSAPSHPRQITRTPAGGATYAWITPPFFPRTRERVSQLRGTNSAGASTRILLHPSRSKWLSPKDGLRGAP